MGFVAGFTGGVTLTLSLTYLALLTHNHNRAAQSTLLRSQAATLDSLLPPDPTRRRRNTSAALPDGTYLPRASLGGDPERGADAARRPVSSFFETAKARWNAEVLGAARWAQTRDWAAARERGEHGLARLLGVELSRERVVVEDEVHVERRPVVAPPPPAQEEVVGLAEVVEGVRGRAAEAGRAVRDRTVLAVEGAREAAREAAARGEAQRKGVVEKGVEGAKEAGEVVSRGVEEAKGAVARGMEKAHDLAGKAKAALHLAEEKVESRLDAKLLHLSDVERALQERYDSALREERLKRSAEEVLRERYLPLDKRDTSRLRWL
ncbi:hypothetical protein BT67DRAFT_486244 [Trichocladium antarcticum]|uniref:MICOS complex subunit MIC12 n=1 Tax=Trichocladium antarcticum TaxID=1450529 RepID=A0AAN6ZBH0_9PEZI|nr:hypothetical protein BT67DRAFT_486244 [Trichocladium antarcticum]